METPLALHAEGVVVSVHPEHGGRIGQILVEGVPLLRGPEDGAPKGWGYWGCYPLLPWSNRIPGGSFTFEGRDLHVPVNWTDGTALHGLAASVPWEVRQASDDRADLVVEIREGPYDVLGTQVIEVTRTHLDLRLAVVNLGDQRVPAGLGIHPWFRAGSIRVPANQVWPGQPLPEGPPRPVHPVEDLREACVPPPMDRCYTGLDDTSVDVGGLQMSWTGPVTQVVVYSEEPVWVCVEPVTMANDGFRLANDGMPGTGVVGLDPGDGLTVSYRFTWTRHSAIRPVAGAAVDPARSHQHAGECFLEE